MKYTLHIKAEITEEQMKEVIQKHNFPSDLDATLVLLTFFDLYTFDNIATGGTGKVTIEGRDDPHFEAYLEKTIKELI